jgi:hypothetical protein
VKVRAASNQAFSEKKMKNRKKNYNQTKRVILQNYKMKINKKFINQKQKTKNLNQQPKSILNLLILGLNTET